MGSWGLFVAVFLACAVEAVEALTIVLAAGLSRGWRSAGTGLLSGLLVLAVLITALGPAVTAIPIGILRLIVGALLLVFGLQWLRKAILRAGGHKPRHDEAAAFAATMAAATQHAPARRGWHIDGYGFTLAFKGVVLEGLEVVFIALSIGSNQHNVTLAAAAAAAAVLVVAVAGLVARAPLTRVPENTMKSAVGVMLTAFGMYWAAEGAGAHWPGSDFALLVLIPAVGGYALALVALMRRRAPGRGPAVDTTTAPTAARTEP
ncbi:hypothetical protein [Mycolicibacterium cosmeticum]|uniref:COG4280 domain-containing protein n=1 Tax=Mycolicibacterium cosmeticum TaxID=258533 RepID=UPI00320485C9